MADRAGFERRLYGSDHFIKWSDADIKRLADHFEIDAKDIPTERDVWKKQKDRARANAAFIVEGPLLHPFGTDNDA